MRNGQSAAAVGPGDGIAQSTHRRRMPTMSARIIVWPELSPSYQLVRPPEAMRMGAHLRPGAGRRNTPKKLGL